MAEISLSQQDLDAIDETLRELDPLDHELLLESRANLSGEEWFFVAEHARRKMRSSLEIGLLARAMASFAQENELADERGADHFLRSKAWVHNFGVSQTADEYFCALGIRTGSRLIRAVDALVEIAQDRLFSTVDEEYRQLFS